MKLKVKIKRSAFMPKRANPTDAGMDLSSCENVRILPGERAMIDTGVHVEIPVKHMGLLVGRSSMGKNGLDVKIGIIDSDYRGSIRAVVENRNDFAAIIDAGQRIAQLIIVPIILANPVKVDELTETKRGERGFGSTGR